MRKIKVLNVIPSLLDGGIEAQLPRLYKCLDSTKYDFYVFCLGNIEKGFAYKRFMDLNCTMECFSFVNVNRKYYHMFWNFFQLLKLTRRITVYRFDVINSHDFFSATMTRTALILARLMFYKPKMSIVTLHNMQYWLSKVHRYINRILSSVTDKVVCVSKSVYEFSRERDKLKQEKYVLTMNGIDIEEFKPDNGKREKCRLNEEFTDEDFIIGHVGSFSVRKGQPILVKAFIELLKRHEKVKLVLVGGYRSHEPQVFDEVQSLIFEHKIENYVKILKTRDDIVSIYNMFDLFVMPSTVEGFGLSLAEAMACCKIAIASDIPPFMEIITHGKEGFLFGSENHEALYKIMDYVVSNFQNLGYIAKQARSRIVNNFSNKNMVQIYDRLYSMQI